MQYQLMEEQYVIAYKLKIFKVVYNVLIQRPQASTVFFVMLGQGSILLHLFFVLYFDQLYILKGQGHEIWFC